MDFPLALRERRTRRRVSQLDLALRAGTTQRHLSFLESGRSVPGRDMVVRLAESLDLPLRERNELLLAAGYAPVYPHSSLDGPALAPVRAAIDHILRGHLPYPALVVDRDGDLVAANAALALITEGAAPELVGPGTNVYRLALHPDGLAPRIRNFAEWARHILARIGHLAELRAELAEYVPDLAPSDGQLGFAVPLRLASSRGELHLMTTVTTFATAVDVTLAELKLEAFLPVDPATAEALAAAAVAAAGPRPRGSGDQTREDA
ncbi:helix-turn-helix domain-containing protein [Frankia sp. CNm7]|uniref:Helix-turn-helix domain-containing protein n=1 Tax=Frankia nepalensis TaxID=1836974 RepID=A0A937URD9_9ACTN|nr:helix-turn-helix domain-containing protein [Frankia nepalensis]MBL7497658.1 helix-turn-helix domain-containing protein [Frankia nepalensis]MBL7510027.1 helix-turn-helix domain-containing protein [Frankia nepalensis]MBL7517563.1 helix-turn-helix domain-containing protein [Frankia nepalensis]MBL7631048.1 helix-turn-helix domain-containing protein [Frankia nepalensis]